MTSAREQIIKSLADKEYRTLFVSEHISQGLAFQIRALRKERGWRQDELGHEADMKQASISLLEDPDYGRFSLSTLKRLASAFDVALMVKFAPFSELVEWSTGLTPQRLAPPSFTEEDLTWRMADRPSSESVEPALAVAGAEPIEAIGTTVASLIGSPPAPPEGTNQTVPSAPREESRAYAVAA